MAERKSDRRNTSARRKRATAGENTKTAAGANKEATPVQKTGWIVGGIVAVLLVLFLAVSSLTMYAGDRNLSKDGVTVMGMDVGGKTVQEIADMLAAADALQNFAVDYTCDGVTKTVTAQDVSLQVDVEKTAQKAAAYGRSNLFTAFTSLFSGKTVAPVYTYDHLALSDISVALSEQCGGSLKQHEVSAEEDKIRISAGSAGTGVEYAQMRKYFEEAVLNGGGSYKLSMVKTQPAQIDIDELYDSVHCEPADAHYVIEGKEVIITPEVIGKDFDKNEAARALAGFDTDSEPVTIALTLTQPQIKAEDISKTLFADVLGKYQTKYATSNRPRSNNVELAAKFVDGTILLPGDEFSYNKIVGERTAERGFKAASVYENNKMVDGLGGGICQTSSTIYAAVLYADLEVTERHEHMLEVHYAPLGMDATVAYGSLDFRFKNNTDAPVKIVAKAAAGKVDVQILGTNANPNKKVEIICDRISYTPYGTTIVNDDTLEPGTEIQDGEGFNGAIVNTYKKITENGKEISNKLLHKSTYRMVNRILRVGPALPDPNAPIDPSVPTVTDPSQAISGEVVVIEGDAGSAQEIYDNLQIPDGI